MDKRTLVNTVTKETETLFNELKYQSKSNFDSLELLKYKKRDFLLDLTKMLIRVRNPKYNNLDITIKIFDNIILDNLNGYNTSYIACIQDIQRYKNNINVSNVIKLVTNYKYSIHNIFKEYSEQ
jgi:hypothetical protein